jgi:GWxTD domain-containing protein
MSRILWVAGLVAALSLPAVASAQERAGQAEFRRGLDAAAQGDTAAALVALDRAISRDPQFAEAHFQRAQLYHVRSSGRPTEFEDRLKAQQGLEEALRLDPHNPLYLVEYGKLMLRQQIRVDAQRIFRRALAAAERADATTLAEVHYQLGIMQETQWLRFRDRHMLTRYPHLNPEVALGDARYAWEVLESSVLPSSQGTNYRDAMLEHFRAALAVQPAHAGAATHLLGFLDDEGYPEEYVQVARRFVRAAPAEPTAYLALGLGLHRTRRPAEAAGAFQYALSIMPEEERRHFEDIGRILSRQEEERLAELEGAARREYQRRYWTLANPLFLTETNEFWLEFMARMAYADIRFGVPESRLRGWDTDRGVIYVRYGAPLRRATFPTGGPGTDMDIAGRVATLWSYGRTGPVFVFSQNPGYRVARFTGDFRSHADEVRYLQPAALAGPALPERHPLPLQVVRFRGPQAGRMDVEIHGRVPLDRLAAGAPVARGEIESGLFVLNRNAAELERVTQREMMELRHAERRVESWRVTLPDTGQYLVGVEAREPNTWVAAVGRRTLEARGFPAGQLSVSDPLLADVVEPLTAEPESRVDFRIVPNPERSYRAERAVALYFEIYNLLPDADQFASYELEITVTVEELLRTGPALQQVLGQLADAWGLTRQGTEAVHLRFGKEARVVARDVVPEYFTIQLPDAPEGRYGVQLLIRDRNAGREARAASEFLIRNREAQ